MHKLLKMSVLMAMVILWSFLFAQAQRVETVDGVRVVHNEKTGKWGKTPKLSLEFRRTIGDMESEDDNVLFYMPSDIAFDQDGNIYVLDSGNHRIQKFNQDGQYLATIGNAGEGPGEFQYPFSFDVDPKGYLYVSDSGNQRIQVLTPEGKDHKTIKLTDLDVGDISLFGQDRLLMAGGGLFSFRMDMMEEKQALPKIFKVLDFEGEVQNEFGNQRDYKDPLTNRIGNMFIFAVDKDKNVYITFNAQNRIEKYSPDGKLLWRAERELNYETDEPRKKGKRRSSRGGNISIEAPQMNRCSSGIAVDDQGRVWVITQTRQLEEGEEVQMRVSMTMDDGGKRSMNLSVESDADIRKTDAYELEIYDTEGVLLGKIPVDHFVDGIWIAKDRVYLLDRNRGMQFFEYEIIEK